MSIPVEANGVRYELEPEGLRQSLTDAPPMLWGFQVRVLKDGEVLGIKTCFVGRVGVQARAPEALEGTVHDLVPVLHELAVEKIRARLELGETGDEIIFA
jgi:hypothetical protein